MPKKNTPFTLPFKLILLYLYLCVFGTALIVVMYAFASKETLFADYETLSTSEDLLRRALTVAASLISVVATVWTVWLLRQRRKDTLFAYAVLIFVNYGVFGIVPGAVTNLTLANVLTAVIALGIDLSILIFLFKSNQAKKTLSQ